MKIKIKFDQQQIDGITRRLRDTGASLPKVMAAAVNDTAKQQKTDISSQIRERVNIKKRDIDPHINFSRATPTHPSSVLVLKKSARLSLRYFGARQNKQGVTYQIDKHGGRVLRPHAFIVRSLSGQVFIRKGPPRPATKGRYVGKMRQAIIKLFGPSPWGVFVKAGLRAETLKNCHDLLRKNLEHRVHFEILKRAGLIPQRKGRRKSNG